MAYTLIPLAPHLVRTAITLEEAYGLLEAADPRSPGVDTNEQIDIRLLARRWLAKNVLHDSPPCFIWSPSKAWFRIPRAYWWKLDWTMDELVNRVGLNPTFDYDGIIDAPPDLHGQDVVVWREAIDALIAINRKPVIAQMRGAARQPSDQRLKPQKTLDEQWSESQMTDAIAAWTKSTGVHDRDLAWRDHFKELRPQHGWDNRSFRVHWPKALGSEGQPGPRKSAQ